MLSRLRTSRCIIIAVVCLISTISLQSRWIYSTFQRIPLDWQQTTNSTRHLILSNHSSEPNLPRPSAPSPGTFLVQPARNPPQIQQRPDKYSLSDIGELIFGSSEEKLEATLARRRIKDTFLRSWNGYVEQAWPHDEVAPIYGGFRNPANAVSLTLISALDTLWVMDLKEEFQAAVEQVGNTTFTEALLKALPFDTIATQLLGGLLGAYDVSHGQYPVLLDQAKNVGDLLLGAFDTTNQLPTRYVEFQHDADGAPGIVEEMTVPELSSFGLEMIRLAQLTGDRRYYEPVDRLTDAFEQWQMQTAVPGLLPYFVDASGCKVGLDGRCHAAYLNSPRVFDNDVYSLGAGIGSVYSNLLKQHLLMGRQEDRFKDMFKKAIAAIKQKLIFWPVSDYQGSLRMIGNVIIDRSKKDDDPARSVFETQVSRSTCSSGAMFALGSKVFKDSRDLALATRLTEGCVFAHNTSRSGVSPAEFMMIECTGVWCGLDLLWYWNVLDIRKHQNFNPENYLPTLDFSLSKKSEHRRRQGQTSARLYDPLQSKTISRPGSVLAHQDFVRDRVWDEGLAPGMTDILSREYDLQPETLESIFTLYRISGNDKWRRRGWHIFDAIDCMTASRYGNARLLDTTKTREHRMLQDVMPQWWLSATLKYAYLLFTDPSLVSLDDYVFNSEGHPFRLPR